MKAVTYNAKQFSALCNVSDILDNNASSPVYYEGLSISEGRNSEKKGIHYWHGFSYRNEEDWRYIVIVDHNVRVNIERWGDFQDPETGGPVSKKYTSVCTPVQGMIQLNVNPQNRDEMLLSFVEVHSDFRGKGLVKLLLEELVNEMKRNGLKLVRSRVSSKAPTWLKPMMDELLDKNGIVWSQPDGYI